jgi:hypothetical protein
VNPFDLIRFDPGDVEHQAFVYDTFRKSTNHWPWSEMSRTRLMDRLKHELASPGTETRIATPHDMPASFLGWYAVRPPATVVYAFTRYSARRQGVARAALGELGIHAGHSWGVVFWTPACARIQAARRDGALYFDIREAFDERTGS